MAKKFSDKIILIAESKNLATGIEQSLEKHKLTIATNYLNLFSLSIIRSQIKNAKGTGFLHDELRRFIQKEGYPYLIALDAHLKSGLSSEKDPDGLRIFKTLLLSLIIQSLGKGLESLKGHIIFLAKENDVENMKNLSRNPKVILDMVDTNEKAVKKIIDVYRNDLSLFGSKFHIDVINADLPLDQIGKKIDGYLTEIENRENLKKLKTEGAAIDTKEYEPARVLFKVNEKKYYEDGNLKEYQNTDLKNLNDDELYVVGYWTNRTQLEVVKKIIRAVLLGITDDIQFDPEERLTINLTAGCTIDAATAASCAMLLSKELVDFKDVIIKIHKENLLILKHSQGFSLIQKQVRVES